MSRATSKEALQRWREWCDTIQRQTATITFETPSEKIARIDRLRKDYAAFVNYYFPHYTDDEVTGKHTDCAPFQVAAANHIRRNRTLYAGFKWARGHAKSTHMDIMIPMWLKCQKVRDLNVMVLVGKSQESANTLLSDLQAELQNNQRYIADFGEQYNAGSWQAGEFVTLDGCAFFARGRGQSPRGLRYRNRRPDYVIIDDLDDDELVENEYRVGKLVNWLREALFGVLDGGRGRFIMIGNLISKKSVLAAWCATEGVHVTQVDAIDKHGRPSWPQKWTIQEIRAEEKIMGYRGFQKEKMNNPITEGAVFKHDWISWKPILPLAKYDHLIAYCDPSFKGTSKNDYKAIKVWGKIGTELHQIDAFVRQCSVSEMVRWWYDLHERITAAGATCGYYIEANFLQDIILDEFTREGNLRGYQLPVRADRRKKPDKFQRIEGISPLWERGFVYYNADRQTDRDTLAGLEQTLAFEKGTAAHDDAPDADEGAIYILQQQTRIQNFTPRIGRRKPPKNAW